MSDLIDIVRALYRDVARRDDQSRPIIPAWLIDPGRHLPRVPRPPIFRPDTEIRSTDPHVLHAVESFFQMAPEMRGRAPYLQHGPDATTAMYFMSRPEGLGPEDYAASELLGLTNIPTRTMTVNPRVAPGRATASDPTFEEVLAHEMGHVAGLPESWASALATLAIRALQGK